LRIATAEQVVIDTLEQRLPEEAVSGGRIYLFSAIDRSVGADLARARIVSLMLDPNARNLWARARL
jgi:hypothetical protein